MPISLNSSEVNILRQRALRNGFEMQIVDGTITLTCWPTTLSAPATPDGAVTLNRQIDALADQ